MDTASGNSFFRKRAPYRQVAVWLIALAFALQSYITQTHIHPLPVSVTAAAHIVLAKLPAQKAPSPDNSPANCPFCQAVMHAGAFFAPAAPIVLLTVVWVHWAAPAFALFKVAHRSARNGLSRAPPAR